MAGNGFNVAPVTFSEIRDWSLLLQIDLSIFEATTLRRLSVVFVEQKELARNKHCAPPYTAPVEVTVEQRVKVDGFLRDYVSKRRK